MRAETGRERVVDAQGGDTFRRGHWFDGATPKSASAIEKATAELFETGRVRSFIRRQVHPPFIPLLALLFVYLSGCGGGTRPQGTTGPAAGVEAQAPVNGAAAIFGKPGAATGGGIVKASVDSSSSQPASPGSPPAAGSPCTASGAGTVHPDGSFSLSVCASAGDRVNLTHVFSGNAIPLGFVVVPSTTKLPPCPAGFRTFKYINATGEKLWLGLTTGGGPPPVACDVSNLNSCGPNQTCEALNACTSFTQCADANQCDKSTGVCMEAPGTVCNGGASTSVVKLSRKECVGRRGNPCSPLTNPCDTGFSCDTSTGLCYASSATDAQCSTKANCGSGGSCIFTDQVTECTGGSCFFAQIVPGENQACSSDADCTVKGQTCNTNLGLCQYSSSTIPNNDLEMPEGATTVLCMPGGVAPGSFWAQGGKITDTSTECHQDTDCASGRCIITGTSKGFGPHVPPNATDCSEATSGQTCTCFPIIGWSGNTFARTGCHDDGTRCDTGDCGNKAFQACPAGKGGSPPDTLAEFTLQANSVDFYDVSVINGVNVSVQMAPDPDASPSPSPGTAPYQCETAGSTAAQGGLTACSWNFDLKSIPGFGDETSLLTQVTFPECDGPAGASCGKGQGVCTPNGVDPTSGAPLFTCVPTADCPAAGCASSPLGNTCGTALINGKFVQKCGTPTGGLWTYDDICGQIAGTGQSFGPVDCTKVAQNPGNGKPPDTVANMFGCNGNPAGSALSCYDISAATDFCCGCPTAPGVASGWPTVFGPSFTNCQKSSVAWQDYVLPWLEHLKDGCPTAYTFPFDDATSTFTCASAGVSSKVPNTMNYDITFGAYKINSSPAD